MGLESPLPLRGVTLHGVAWVESLLHCGQLRCEVRKGGKLWGYGGGDCAQELGPGCVWRPGVIGTDVFRTLSVGKETACRGGGGCMLLGAAFRTDRGCEMELSESASDDREGITLDEVTELGAKDSVELC